jgi:Arc/MetJ family transcription regulator
MHHLVYDRSMGRTNIHLDDRLVAAVMQRYGLRTKREAVDLALRRLVGEPPVTEEILQLEGSGWQADLDEIRTSRVANDP